ncbi:MAG: sodium-dependent transporter [Acidobacteria bacterium]|nr:sodium-dependent transporter [Acidobacteriota bacterium]
MPETPRETFSSKVGVILTTIGVAVGLGNVWRFPYMVGKYGGAAFVAFYVLVVVAIGVPGLVAEFALGRNTRRGTVGAFERSGFPGGRAVGWFFFAVVTAATAYYTNVIGWVLLYAVSQAGTLAGLTIDPSSILPPETGFSARSVGLQILFTSIVIAGCAWVLVAGVRRGIERASRLIMPAFFVILGVLIVRSVTLPGAFKGIEWYVLKLRFADLNGSVMVAAMGQAVFSLSLGGTFMVVYGSYLGDDIDVRRVAWWTAIGDTAAGLLAGLAIFPAVFAFGIEPSSGPSLIFSTLPRAFALIPAGGLFGVLFFLGLVGVAFLSDVAAFEVLVAGLADNTRIPRRRAVLLMSLAVLALSIPPMINMRVFVGWDLTFGSGMQTLGALLAVVAVAWSMNRAAALEEIGKGGGPAHPWLLAWLRYVVPLGIVSVGGWWMLHDVLGVLAGP